MHQLPTAAAQPRGTQVPALRLLHVAQDTGTQRRLSGGTLAYLAECGRLAKEVRSCA